MTKELIEKLEALQAPDAATFVRVFNFLHAQPVLQCLDIGENWQRKHRSFWGLIGQEAWESAAIMLVPDGSFWTMDTMMDTASLFYTDNDGFHREIKHGVRPFGSPAIALLICILKAKEPVE